MLIFRYIILLHHKYLYFCLHQTLKNQKMKKIAVLISGAFLLMNAAFAGGLLTNTNQSAQFTRMISRNASIDMDAVYYNPAGLTQLKNGFYLSLNNQSLFQTRSINSEFPTLNNADYKGIITVPAFPTAFAVYRKDKWAFSFGFGPNGGGGSAKYDRGLPNFEKPISTLPPSLSLSGIITTQYSADIQFEGASVFWGSQLNASYSINKILAVSLGVRMITAVNTYNGYIKNIMINPTNPASGNLGFDGTMHKATDVFNSLSAVSTAASNLITPYIQDAGGYTLDQLVTAKMIAPDKAAMLSGGLGSNYSSSMTLTQVKNAYETQAAGLTGRSLATADKTVDVKQSGKGFTPIIGIDLHLEKLNVGLKYEHQTILTLTNATDEDGTGLFPDEGETGSNIPAILSGGADYQLLDKLKLSGSFTYFMDKNVEWYKNVYGQERTIDKNYLELSFGAEYRLNDQFTLSAGYLNSNAGVSEQYLSDFSYVNDANGIGTGFQWNINKRLIFDAGVMMIKYKDHSKNFDASFDPLATSFGSYKETYGKDSFSFAIGISYKIL
jgi:long-subunit fatty acid transport protein